MICCFHTQEPQKSHWNVIFPMALNFLFSNCLLLSKLLLELSTYFTITSPNFAIMFCRRFGSTTYSNHLRSLLYPYGCSFKCLLIIVNLPSTNGSHMPRTGLVDNRSTITAENIAIPMTPINPVTCKISISLKS